MDFLNLTLSVAMIPAPKWMLHNAPYHIRQKDDEPLKNNLEIIWARNTMIWKHWRLAGSINHYQLHSFSLLSPSSLLQRYRTHSKLSKYYSSIITTQNGRMWKNKKLRTVMCTWTLQVPLLHQTRRAIAVHSLPFLMAMPAQAACLSSQLHHLPHTCTHLPDVCL